MTSFNEQTFRTWLRMHPRGAIAGFAGKPSGCIMHSFLNDLPGVEAFSVSGTYWMDSEGQMHDMPEWATGVVRSFDSILHERLRALDLTDLKAVASSWSDQSPFTQVTFGQFARAWDPVLVDA
jgi:hypothetical protein